MTLTNKGGTARLDGLDLCEVDRGATEAGRQLGHVEEDAVGGLDRAQASTGRATNTTLGEGNRLLEGTVLLGTVTVGAERGVRSRGKGFGEFA